MRGALVLISMSCVVILKCIDLKIKQSLCDKENDISACLCKPVKHRTTQLKYTNIFPNATMHGNKFYSFCLIKISLKVHVPISKNVRYIHIEGLAHVKFRYSAQKSSLDGPKMVKQ